MIYGSQEWLDKQAEARSKAKRWRERYAVVAQHYVWNGVRCWSYVVVPADIAWRVKQS